MFVYRIVKSEIRSRDLSGRGAFIEGGRWNNPGTFALYTSMNSSLAILEILVHFDASDFPPNMFVMKIEVRDTSPIYDFPDQDLPTDWRNTGNFELKAIGEKILNENKFLGIRARSAVNPEEFNLVLNPLFPGFAEMVTIKSVHPYDVDERLA